jgi:antitoxin PrlF
MDGKEAIPTRTLTNKGQITIPKELRDQLHLKKGSRLEFVVETSGRVILKPLNSDFRSLRGMIRSKRRRPVPIEEMSFPDYVIGEINHQAGCRDTVSFDRDLRKALGFTVQG